MTTRQQTYLQNVIRHLARKVRLKIREWDRHEHNQSYLLCAHYQYIINMARAERNVAINIYRGLK